MSYEKLKNNIFEINKRYLINEILKLTKRIEVLERNASEDKWHNDLAEATKHDQLANLFDGAPVMCRDNTFDANWYRRHYRKDKQTYNHSYISNHNDYSHWNEIRLPTIDESPRNTWLCATPELIEQTEGLDCLFWCSNGGFITRKHYEIKGETVQRFMILEK